ncbi:hypothetical protein DCC81_15765 [Chitinophaga parva]|uniref:Glycosyl transferase family 1 domain-containing protein n=1 Tax=Chitinophaga parva TaxID=2169414 RepID=A0A2T7BHG9_9BACT|nr:glycosyltransferase [Chitinophaga parva]PUZ25722.1 hypothetical protein DCC81_15765 [Chitinophaga parva]
MAQRKPHLLFIGHEGSFSGAPILLLNLMLLVKEEVDITLVVRRDGPYVKEYARHFPVMVLKSAGYGKGGILKRLGDMARNRWQLARLFARMPRIDLVFNNTIVNGKLLKTLAFFKKPVATYVHELDEVIKAYLPTGDAALTFTHTRQFVYPSLKVKQVLQSIGNVPEQRLQALNYYFPVDMSLVHMPSAFNAYLGDFRLRYGLEDASMVVGGMGLVSQRKGTDIFVETCAAVVKENPDIRFCWIGSFESPEEEARYRKMLMDKGLQRHLVFTGPLPHSYYNTIPFDVFFLSSREDPYPLVVLEAAFMGVPSVCFAGGGGIPEFVGNDAGWVLPQMTAAAAARLLLGLYNDLDAREQKGKQAMRKGLALHGDPTLVVSQFRAIIDPLLDL